MTDLTQTKEHQLAKQVFGAINSYSFDPRKFAEAIPGEHPTLQQSLYRLIRECIKALADDNRHIDDRNRASHDDAKAMMRYLEGHGRAIPFI